MKLSSWLSPSAGDRSSSSRRDLLIALLVSSAQAIAFNSIPPPNLELDSLGRIALAGDFDAISLYRFEGQNENGFSTNGSQSILSRFPDGGFATLASADAAIRTMCPFVMKSGKLAGIVVGGNFTSLGGMESQAVALFDPTTSKITPLTGLSGQVSALLCDQEQETVYVGGSFKGANSTNAIAWVGTAGWTNLPFAGFNGPVTSISKASDGHIIFGGTFTGLGNATAPTLRDQQVINIAGGAITSGASSSTAGFSDPKNIICKTGGVDGPGNTWLLADNAPGFWDASFRFGFQPTKLRLWNTHQDGRGVKTWRYTAQPINGIMNFTYTDPVTKAIASCSSECPLSNDPNIKFQDFHFVNVIGMSQFRIDISAWYGNGAGLNGIELFQDDIYAYAVNNFNEPTCATINLASTSTNTGPWTVTPSGQSVADYLSATITDTASASVTFLPDIKQSGNYSVNIYTPGCIQDNSCATRGRVSITIKMGTSSGPITQEISQTNNFEKYDQIYYGFVNAGDASFRPSVTLSSISGQNIPNYSVVAQRVGFTLISSSVGLNNLFEFDPTKLTTDNAGLESSTFTKAGVSLGITSEVNALTASGSTTFVGGNFTTKNANNILAISGSDVNSLAGSGLNGAVMEMFLNGTILYVGGTFTNTNAGGSLGLNHIATYDTGKNSWDALGAGVNGIVNSIVPLSVNITTNVPEIVITVTGEFDQILAFGTNKAVSVSGFAVWVPSKSNWLQNLPGPIMSINGELTAAVDVPGGGSLFAGSISSSQLLANGAVGLTSAGSLNALPINIQSSQAKSGIQKRSTSAQNVTGVVTGLFSEDSGRNITVLGGHFTATATDGSDVHNLAFIDGAKSDTVTGIGSGLSNDSTVLALAVQGDLLYVGGSLTGTVNGANINGIVSYNLANTGFPSQPPPLAGDSVAVHAISVRPGTSDVYVAGAFSDAGALDCPAVCVYSISISQWNRPGATLGGLANVMIWTNANSLVAGGALLLNGVSTTLATFDTKLQEWAATPGSGTIPGPVTALTAADSDGSELWVSGTASNGSTFLMQSSNGAFSSVGDVFGAGTVIRGLQVLPVSKNHASTSLVSSSEVIMITGSLVLPGFGNASSALYDGKTFRPFALTTTSNRGGSLSQMISQKQMSIRKKKRGLAVGFVVLISLAISLVLIFLIVLAGIIAERIRRKREGYMPAPTSSYDRGAAMTRMPPQQLFSSIGQNRSGIEKQSNFI